MKQLLKNIKHSGFSTPKQYFATLEKKLLPMGKTKPLEATSTGFKAPNNYFNTLENKILIKSITQQKSTIPLLFNKTNLIYLTGVAAALVISFNIYKAQPTLGFNTINVELVEHYLFETEIPSEEMVSLFTNETLINDEFTQNNITEEAIETYLLNDDIDALLTE